MSSRRAHSGRRSLGGFGTRVQPRSVPASTRCRMGSTHEWPNGHAGRPRSVSTGRGHRAARHLVWRTRPARAAARSARRSTLAELGLHGDFRVAAADVLFFPWSVLPRLLVAPAVVTVHDVCFRSHPKVFPDGGRRGDRQLRAVLRSATAVLTPSAASKRGVVEAYGVEANRVTVVRHGVEPMFRVQPDPADRGADPTGATSCVSAHMSRARTSRCWCARTSILSSAGMHPRKCPTSCSSATITRTTRPGCAGTSTGHRVRCGRPRLSNRCPMPDWRRCTASAIAVALPSVCEGFGFPLVEAVASGTR